MPRTPRCRATRRCASTRPSPATAASTTKPYFTELARLDADVPLMIEHINARQLRWATDYLYEQAARAGIAIRHADRRTT